MKIRLIVLLMLIFCGSAYADIHCPEVAGVSRVPGEYAWNSQDGRWQGYFAVPRIGRGDSNAITFFKGARWIQLTNMPHSAGVTECDYVGNYGNEVIRFVSTNSLATSKPTSTFWMCEINPEIPATQCNCSGTPEQCALPL